LGDEAKSNDWRMWNYFHRISTPVQMVNADETASHTGTAKDEGIMTMPEMPLGLVTDAPTFPCIS
jgi:hypothetical protein